MKIIYALLAVLGLLIPMSQMVPWFMEHGFDLLQFLRDAGTNRLGMYAWAGILLTMVCMMIFIVIEGGGRLRMGCILPGVAATLLVGPAFGLPLFLLLREYELDKKTALARVV